MPVALPTTPLSRAPLWPIVERHFGELELLLELRAEALHAPDYDLDALETGPDRRALDHLAGLRCAGRELIEAVVEPALAAVIRSPTLASASSLALLTVGSQQDWARVLELLDPDRFDPAFRAEVVRGCSLAAGVDAWLQAQLDEHEQRAANPIVLASLVTALAGRGRAPTQLPRLLARAEPELLAAAATAARYARDPDSAAVLAPLGRHDDASVRANTIESALVREIPGAWAAACYAALDQAQCPFRARARTWVALLGAADVHARLLDQLAGATAADERAQLLWVAGFTGRPRAIEFALRDLADPRLGPLAAELIVALAGEPADADAAWLEPVDGDDESLPALELDELDADLSLQSEQLLAVPNPEFFAAWWAREGPRLRELPRVLAGAAWSPSGLLTQLRHGPLRRRHALALELAVRSRGQLELDTHGWAHTQLHQLGSAKLEHIDRVDGLGVAR